MKNSNWNNQCITVIGRLLFRADVEISEHIDPRIVGYGCGLFVGNMTISTISTHCFVPLKRKLSQVNDSIVESSNDFLA